jgi:hypothetical protein
MGVVFFLIVVPLLLAILVAFVIIAIASASTAAVGVGGMAASTFVKKPLIKSILLLTFGGIAPLALSWLAPMIFGFIRGDLLAVGFCVALCLCGVSFVLSILALVKTLKAGDQIRTAIKVPVVILLSFILCFNAVTTVLLGISLWSLLSTTM